MTFAGKTIFITGSTDGLGKALAQDIAQPGVSLILHGRSSARGEEILGLVEQKGATARFIEADLSSLAEAERLATEVAGHAGKLDVLINNAGVGFGSPNQGRQVSADGYELRFAVNYLAPVLLTDRLLGLLTTAAPSKIVNVASIGQKPLDFDNVMLEQDYSGPRAYQQSKLAMIMWTIELAAHLKAAGVVVNAVHPATFMPTAMVREMAVEPVGTVAEGVAAVMHLIGDELPNETTGAFFKGQDQAQPNAQALDAAARDKLRLLTKELIGVDWAH